MDATEEKFLRLNALLNHSVIFRSKDYPYLNAIIVVAVCTATSGCLFNILEHSNLIMVYLLGVVYVATINSQQQGPAILAALLSTLAFDFFFIPPFYSFAVSDIQYFFTLVVMLIVTQTISHLTIRVHRHIEATRGAKMQANAERLRNILLTSISHDMRTPLTVIMGSAGTLLQTKDIGVDQCKELAKNIYDESKRLNNIIVNVLQVIRLESGTIKINKHLQSIEDVVNDVVARYAEESNKHAIVVQICKHLPFIPFDHMLLEQVFVNLIENAIKHSPSDMPIEITIRMRGKNILVKIADHGEGIPVNDLENIFQKFHRGSKLDSTKDGFGLGLTICKHIIEAHSGKIWAENHKNGGALFYFTLPC